MAAPDLQADWDRTQSLFRSDIQQLHRMETTGGKRQNWGATGEMQDHGNHPASPAALGRPFPTTLWKPWNKGAFPAPCPALEEGGCAHSSLWHISLCPLMGQLSPGDNPQPQAPGEGAAPGAGADGRGKETFGVHTGMKQLCFFLLPLKDSTT